MKSSEYNILVKLDDEKSLAYNSFTTDLSIVDERFSFILDNIEKISEKDLSDDYKEIYEKMKIAGYIIDESIEEINYLKTNYFKAKYSDKKSFVMTIAPTLNCNFGCEYCFEERQNKKITKDVEEKIYEIVKSQTSQGKTLGITWFGGEPMLTFDVIVRMTKRFKEICDNNNVTYNASIITNGYLFSETRIETFKNLSINSIQITIDGPQRIHDQRRYLLNGNPTFDKIIENVKLLINAKQNVSIRINIDKTNVDDVDELLQFLKSKGIDSALISFGHMKMINKSCNTLEKKCLSRDDYSKKHRKLTEELEKNELAISSLYPKRKAIYCSADRSQSSVVDPEGYLYKCWNHIGIKDKRVGNILEKSTPEQTAFNHKYLLHTPFENTECKKCKLLPICMGGCPDDAISNGHLDCHIWKYGFEDYLIDTYKRISK